MRIKRQINLENFACKLVFWTFAASLASSLNNNTAVAEAKEVQKTSMVLDVTDYGAYYVANVLDPHADLNLIFTETNKQLADALTPLAEVYMSPGAAPVRMSFKAIGNVDSNLQEGFIGTPANIIAGQWQDATHSASRFTVNIIGGVGGIIPLADIFAKEPIKDLHQIKNLSFLEQLVRPLNLGVGFLKKPKISNFSDAFGADGIGCGVYLVLPLVGPTTERSLWGSVAELPLNPDTYVKPLIIATIANKTDQMLRDVNLAKSFSADLDMSKEEDRKSYYEAVRSAVMSANGCLDQKKMEEYAKQKNIKVIENYGDE